MAKNIPLLLPEDPATHPAILTRWAQELEKRLHALERKHLNLLEQVQKLKNP